MMENEVEWSGMEWNEVEKQKQCDCCLYKCIIMLKSIYDIT